MKRTLQALLVCFLVMALGGYGFYRYRTRHLIFAPAEVEALASRLLPGAKPLPGIRGVVATEKGESRVAVLAPSLNKAKPANLSGKELRFIIAGLNSRLDPENLDSLVATADKVREVAKEQGLRLLNKGPKMVYGQGRPRVALHLEQEVGQPPVKIEEYLFLFEGQEGGMVLLLVTGPKETFDKDAMVTFLDGLESSHSNRKDGERDIYRRAVPQPDKVGPSLPRRPSVQLPHGIKVAPR